MPSLTSVSPTLTRSLINYFLSLFGPTGTVAKTVTVTAKLFTAAPMPITPTSGIDEFTEATFEGYLPVDITVFPSILAPSQVGIGAALNAFFVGNVGNTIPENIQGYYIIDAVGPSLLMGEYFPAPVPITAGGEFIDLLALLVVAFSPTVSP